MKSKDISLTIQKAMLDKGITRKSLASKTGKDISTISRRLSRIDTVSLGELQRMAKILGLEIVIRGENK